MMRWDGWMRSGCKTGLIVLAIVILGNLPAWAEGPTAADENAAAAKALADARTTYQQKNYQAAADQFRSFIKTYEKRPEVPSARYGLALALAAMPQPDYNAIVEALTPTVGAAFPEKPYALYYLGLGYRGQGLKDAAGAKQKFEQAGEQFAAAAAGFAALPKTAPTPGRELPVEMDWTCRAKCDQADVLIRAGHFKDALAIVEPLTKDPSLAKSRYGKLAGFYVGSASFGLNDFGAAGRAL